MTVKVGVIDFLNSLPVYLALENGAVPTPVGVEIVKGAPTTLNAMSARGELAVTPVSSIHYARNWRELALLPGIGINSRGFVHSVTLFYRDDLSTLERGTIVVTDESATSEVLLKILLARRFGLDARVVRGKPDLEAVGRDYDGALLIGDGALAGTLAYPNLGRRDLGLEWVAHAGLPMVFAVWAARRDFARNHPETVRAIAEAFARAKAWGRAHRPEIVDAARARSNLPRPMLDSYFRSLDYDLDDEALRGLAAYWRAAKEIGELGELPELEATA